MLICNCSLAGTQACINCPQYSRLFDIKSEIEVKKLLKIIETTEYIDEYGKVIKRVIEEIQ